MNKKTEQRGFATLAVALAVLAILAVGGAWYYVSSGGWHRITSGSQPAAVISSSSKSTDGISNGGVSPETPPIVGGKCSYISYRGTCKITGRSSADAGTFRFVSDAESVNATGSQAINKADIIGRDWQYDANGIAPLWNQSQRDNIRVGDEFGCKVQIETGGTCTPVIFTFDPTSAE